MGRPIQQFQTKLGNGQELPDVYPLASAYFDRAVCTGEYGVFENLTEKTTAHAQKLGFAFRTYGHCDNVALLIHHPSFHHLIKTDYRWVPEKIEAVFSVVEEELRQKVETGESIVPSRREPSPGAKLFSSPYDAGYLHREVEASKRVMPDQLGFVLSRSGVDYFEYFGNEFLIWKKDILKLTERMANVPRNWLI